MFKFPIFDVVGENNILNTKYDTSFYHRCTYDIIMRAAVNGGGGGGGGVFCIFPKPGIGGETTTKNRTTGQPPQEVGPEDGNFSFRAFCL